MPNPIGWILNEASRLQGGLNNFANTGGLDARIRALFGNPVRAAAPAAPTTWAAGDMYGGGGAPVYGTRTPTAPVSTYRPVASSTTTPAQYLGRNERMGDVGARAALMNQQGGLNAKSPGAAGQSGMVYVEGLGWVDPEEFMTGLGGLGGADNSVAWAQMEMERQQWQDRMRLEEQQMAQAAELARLEREQRAREMAASIGQFLAGQSSQNWATAMPYVLPKGTRFAPGFEPGGPAARLAQIGGSQYTPPPLAVSNPPSNDTLKGWVDEALAAFARG
jgi:hypothetical protein